MADVYQDFLAQGRIHESYQAFLVYEAMYRDHDKDKNLSDAELFGEVDRKFVKEALEVIGDDKGKRSELANVLENESPALVGKDQEGYGTEVLSEMDLERETFHYAETLSRSMDAYGASRQGIVVLASVLMHYALQHVPVQRVLGDEVLGDVEATCVMCDHDAEEVVTCDAEEPLKVTGQVVHEAHENLKRAMDLMGYPQPSKDLDETMAEALVAFQDNYQNEKIFGNTAMQEAASRYRTTLSDMEHNGKLGMREALASIEKTSVYGSEPSWEALSMRHMDNSRQAIKDGDMKKAYMEFLHHHAAATEFYQNVPAPHEPELAVRDKEFMQEVVKTVGADMGKLTQAAKTVQKESPLMIRSKDKGYAMKLLQSAIQSDAYKAARSGEQEITRQAMAR